MTQPTPTPAPQQVKIPRIWSIDPAGKLQLSFHPGQSRTWIGQKRFNMMLAGTQGGKVVPPLAGLAGARQ